MRKFATLPLALLLVALGLNVRAADNKAEKPDAKDASKLEGRYELVGGEESGKQTPAEHIKGSVVIITGNAIVGTDKDKKEFFSCTYKLDTSSKPWKITMTSKEPKQGDKAEGVVEVSGDTLKICYALPGGKTPTSFKTEEKQNCFVLKKVDR